MQDYVLPWTNRRQDEYHDIIKGRAPQTYRDPYRKLMMGSGNRVYHYTFFDPNLEYVRESFDLEAGPRNISGSGTAVRKARHLEWQHWTLEEGWHRQFSRTTPMHRGRKPSIKSRCLKWIAPCVLQKGSSRIGSNELHGAAELCRRPSPQRV